MEPMRSSTSTVPGLARYGHAAQGFDALGKRWVSAKETLEYLAPAEGHDDIKRRGSRRDVGHGNALIVRAQLFERANQSIGMAHQACPSCIRRIFALSRNAQLDQQSGDWRYDQHEKRFQAA